jgi:8-oxo-dGTP diphosphatase
LDSRKQLIADALILDGSGRIFVQQRTLTRKLFPGCWDLVGGHVEDNEDVIAALRREIREETGWTLRTIRHEISVKAWSDGPNQYEERQFIVDVDGDLQEPVLEAGKVSGWMWVDRTNVEKLKENREAGDQLIYDSVLEALGIVSVEWPIRDHHLLSSSAKADDPVLRGGRDERRSRSVLDHPLSRVMTIERGEMASADRASRDDPCGVTAPEHS